MPKSPRSNLLTPRELAEAIGVSESSVKRWADDGALEVSRTAGGHRRIERREAVRFIRQTGASVVRPHLLGMEAPEPGEPVPGDDPEELLFRWLFEGDGPRVDGLLQSLYLNGTSVAALIDGPIRGAFRRIGEIWHDNPEAVFEEHRALDLMLQALRGLAGLQPRPDEDAPVALGGAVTDDPHQIPTLGVSMVLVDAGYRSINLGPDTPATAMVAGCRKVSPPLIWVSVSSRPSGGLGDYWRELLDGAPEEVRVVAGGREIHGHERIDDRRFVPLDTMKELAAFLEGLRA